MSVKFEAAVWFYKVTGAHQRLQVEEKRHLYLKINFDVAVFDDRSGI